MKWNKRNIIVLIKNCIKLFYNEKELSKKIIIYNNYCSLIEFLEMTDAKLHYKLYSSLSLQPNDSFLELYNLYIKSIENKEKRIEEDFINTNYSTLLNISSKLNNNLLFKPFNEDINMSQQKYLKTNKQFFSCLDDEFLKIYNRLKKGYIYFSNKNEYENYHGKVIYLSSQNKSFVYINSFNNCLSTLSHEIAHIYEDEILSLNHKATVFSEVFAYTIEKIFIDFLYQIDPSLSLNSSFNKIHSNLVFTKQLNRNSNDFTNKELLLYLNDIISTYLFYFYKYDKRKYSLLLKDFENRLKISDTYTYEMFDSNDLVNVNLEYINEYNLKTNNFNKKLLIKN